MLQLQRKDFVMSLNRVVEILSLPDIVISYIRDELKEDHYHYCSLPFRDRQNGALEGRVVPGTSKAHGRPALGNSFHYFHRTRLIV